MQTPGLRAAPRGLVLSPDDAVAVAARAVLRFHLRTFARSEGPARGGEVEPVHQLRVATRRLRAALRFFRPLPPARFVGWARREMAWLGDTIGAVRDLDVLGQAVSAHAARLDPQLRGALGPLALTIHDRRSAAHVDLVAALDSRRCRRLLDRLAAFADASVTVAQPRLGEVAQALISPLERAALRAGRRIGGDSPPEALHRVRVRIKRLRYALETLRGLGGKGLRKWIRRLEDLQDLLGEHQDAVVQIEWLRRFADTAEAPPATLLATGALIHRLGRRARKRRARFQEAFERVDQRRLRTQVTAEIGERARSAALRVAS